MYKVSLMMSLAAMGTYGYVMERQGKYYILYILPKKRTKLTILSKEDA